MIHRKPTGPRFSTWELASQACDSSRHIAVLANPNDGGALLEMFILRAREKLEPIAMTSPDARAICAEMLEQRTAELVLLIHANGLDRPDAQLRNKVFDR